MARIRRLAAVAGGVALAASMVSGPARADSPEVFQGNAVGTALDLSILGKQATLGSSEAKADSAGNAEAKGAGVLSSTNATVDGALTLKSTEKVAKASSGSPDDVKAKTCGKSFGVEGIDALSFGLACSAASAKSAPAPSATGEGSVVEAGVDVTTVIDKFIAVVETVEQQHDEDLSAVKDGITEIGGTVAGLLDPVCEAAQGQETAQEHGADDLACAATTTVQDLVTSVLKTKTLEVGVGATTSSVDTTTSSVTSKAFASGAVVKLLPLPQVNGLASSKPVVTITVGEANASATYDRGAGNAAGTADPAIVRISFNTALTDALQKRLGGDLEETLPKGVSLTNIVITPKTLVNVQETLGSKGAPGVIEPCEGGKAICILSDTPLASKVWPATSSVKTNADGSVVATANAVRMELATGSDFDELLDTVNEVPELAALGLKGPGVRLALAGVEAGVGGRKAQVTDQDDGNGGGGGSGGPGDAPALTPEQSRTLPPAELPRTGGTPWVPLIGATALALAVIGRRAAAQAQATR